MVFCFERKSSHSNQPTPSKQLRQTRFPLINNQRAHTRTTMKCSPILLFLLSALAISGSLATSCGTSLLVCLSLSLVDLLFFSQPSTQPCLTFFSPPSLSYVVLSLAWLPLFFKKLFSFFLMCTVFKNKSPFRL